MGTATKWRLGWRPAGAAAAVITFEAKGAPEECRTYRSYRPHHTRAMRPVGDAPKSILSPLHGDVLSEAPKGDQLRMTAGY